MASTRLVKRQIKAVLTRMGLPENLIDLIRSGRLEHEIADAYASLDGLNAALDAWELANPAAAQLVPWHEGREAWKRAGRPRPEWYEALLWHGVQPNKVPIRKRDILCDLLNTNTRDFRAKLKAKKRALK